MKTVEEKLDYINKECNTNYTSYQQRRKMGVLN
jgi:hypothetical protein